MRKEVPKVRIEQKEVRKEVNQVYEEALMIHFVYGTPSDGQSGS